MLRRRVAFGAVFAVALASAWLVGSDRASREPSLPPHTNAAERGVTHRSPPARVSRGPSLSLNQLAGQRIVFEYSGLRPPASLLSLVREGQAGGVIFFADKRARVGTSRAGLNVNLAPVLDVYRQAGNFIDEFQRSY